MADNQITINKTIQFLLYLFLFLLPWQAMWIWHNGFLNGHKWEYGTFVLYGNEALLWVIFLLFFIQQIKKRRIKNYKLKIKIIFVFLIWSLLSVLWSGDKELVFYWWFRLLEGIILLYLFLYLKLDFKKITLIMVLAGAIQSILAVFQFMGQQVTANKWLGIAGQLPEKLGVSVVQYDVYRWLRAYGSFSHPNALGGFLVVCFLLALWLYFPPLARRGRLGEGMWRKYLEGWQKIFITISLIIISIGIFFTFSRSAWLSVLVGTAVYFIFDKNHFKKWMRIFTYLLVVFVILFLIYKPLVITRLSTGERLEKISIEQRLDSIKEGKKIIKDNWLLGVGIGNYTKVFYQNNPNLYAWDYQPVHNIFLLVWAELGVIGVLLYGYIIVLLLKQTIQRKNYLALSLLTAVLIITIFDHYLWTSYAGIMIFWLVMGINRDMIYRV